MTYDALEVIQFRKQPLKDRKISDYPNSYLHPKHRLKKPKLPNLIPQTQSFVIPKL